MKSMHKACENCKTFIGNFIDQKWIKDNKIILGAIAPIPYIIVSLIISYTIEKFYANVNI
jgi:hypothetical protein